MHNPQYFPVRDPPDCTAITAPNVFTWCARMLAVCCREEFAGARWNEWTAGSWLQVGAPDRLSLGFGLVLGVVAGFGDCS